MVVGAIFNPSQLDSSFFVCALIYQTGSSEYIYKSDLSRLLEILDAKGYDRSKLKIETIGIDLEYAQKRAIESLGFKPVYDILHLIRS